MLTPHAPGSFDESLLNRVEILQDGEGSYRTLGLRFDVDGSPATVGLKLDTNIGLTNLRGRPMFDWQTGTVAYGALQTDADFAFVLDRGKAREIGLISGSRLCWNDQTLFDMPLSQHMYQGPVDYEVPERKDRMPRWHEILG